MLFEGGIDGITHLRSSNILVNEWSGRLLEGVEYEGEGRGGIALGEEFGDEEEIVGAAVLERGGRHDFGCGDGEVSGGGGGVAWKL